MKRNSWNSSTVREQEELLISPCETAKLTSSDRLFLRRHLIPPPNPLPDEGARRLEDTCHPAIWNGLVDSYKGHCRWQRPLPQWFTPLKWNMEPENQPLEKEIPIRNFGRVYDLSQCHGLHHFPASRMPCSTSCCTSNSLRSPSSFVSNISNLSCSARESGSGPNWQQWNISRPKAQSPKPRHPTRTRTEDDKKLFKHNKSKNTCMAEPSSESRLPKSENRKPKAGSQQQTPKKNPDRGSKTIEDGKFWKAMCGYTTMTISCIGGRQKGRNCKKCV